MRRLFWLALGITLGVLTMRRLSRLTQRAAEAITPSGIAQTLSDAAARTLDGVRNFVQDVRASTKAREAELREGAGLDAGTGPAPEATPNRPDHTG